MPPRRKSTPIHRRVNPQDPATWLKPDEPLIGADGRDWSWAYVWFKDIRRFPGYRAGWDGSIWSHYTSGQKDRIAKAWKRLKGTPEKRSGYRKVTLKNGDGYMQVFVHILVLESFVGPCPDGLQCRHLDGKPRNNRLDNLAWGTVRENAEDRMRHGTHLFGEKHGRALLGESDVHEIRRRLAAGETNASLAREFGVSDSTIRYACRYGWKHTG